MSRTFLPVVACAALVIGGCGEDGAGSAGGRPPEERLTKQAYIAQADAICAETADQQQMIEDRIAELGRGNLLKGLTNNLRDQVKRTRAGFRRLQKLRPPAADQAQVDEWLLVVGETIDQYSALATALRTGRRTGTFRAVRVGGRLDGEQEILADLLGLVDCRDLV